jgi:hypothetical protein
MKESMNNRWMISQVSYYVNLLSDQTEFENFYQQVHYFNYKIDNNFIYHKDFIHQKESLAFFIIKNSVNSSEIKFQLKTDECQI